MAKTQGDTEEGKKKKPPEKQGDTEEDEEKGPTEKKGHAKKPPEKQGDTEEDEEKGPTKKKGHAKKPPETQGASEEGEEKKPTEKKGEGKKHLNQKGEKIKVKQVTFDVRPKKEPRKRIKHLLNPLRSQMEFYFGDSNMNKDRFMSKKFEEDPENYIPVSVFMSFNKIQSVTTDTDILVKAIQTSELLQLNEDKTKVKRIAPLKKMSLEEIDARTVYVEGFHKFITREWIHDKFSICGKITYISIPKFKTTEEIKGFAFVEFETPEEAENAVEMLNSVPEEQLERMAMESDDETASGEDIIFSIKECKNLTYWKKRAIKEGIDPAEVETSLKKLMKDSLKRKKRKNRATRAETTTTTTAQINTTNSTAVSEEAKENALKQEVDGEADETKTKKSKKAKKRRKRKAAQISENPESIAAQPKESEMPVKTEAGDSTNLKASTIKTNEQDSSEDGNGKPSRKRQRLNEEDLESVKVSIYGPDSTTDNTAKTDDKKGDTLELSETHASKSSLGKLEQNKSLNLPKPEPAPVKENVAKKGDKSKKRKADTAAETPQEKQPKVKKQKKEGKLGKESRKGLDQTPETTTGEGRKRKRKIIEGADESGSNPKKKKSNAGSESELASETEEPAGKQTKNRHRRHKQAKPEIRLRVMSKATWVRLKEEYLQYQKDNMRQLKDLLKEAARKRKDQFKNKTSPHKSDTTSGRPPPEFVPNTVLEVKGEAELCLQTIKADIRHPVELAYVDIRPGMTEGYIRCQDAESAALLLKTGLRGLSLSLVEGEAEKEYWDKLITNRQNKLSDLKRRKRRGKLKILQRAQNPQGDISHRQHLFFSEDDGEEGDTENAPHHPQVVLDDEFNTYSGRETPPHLRSSP